MGPITLMRSPDGLRGTHHTNEAGRALTEVGAVAYTAVQHCPVSSLCPLSPDWPIGQTPRYLLTFVFVCSRRGTLKTLYLAHPGSRFFGGLYSYQPVIIRRERFLC